MQETQEQKDRRAKVARLREAGIQPYAEKFARTHSLEEAKQLPVDAENVAVAGRILQARWMGKLAFIRLSDQTGDYQVVLEKNALGDNFKLFEKNLDIGDFIGATGKTFETKHGEPSLLAAEVQLLTKAISPLPEKFHGLADQEKKYRERYLDLATNRETMDRFLFRSRLVQSLRNFFQEKGYLEVETPVLQNKASGAVARPFYTHHNALDIDCVLRIAPETYLKRCLVGGFEKVFEVARCFRNEGIDPTHLQDFTMLELYAAYENYEYLMDLAEEMFQKIITDLLGTSRVTIEGQEVDFGGDWPRIDMMDEIAKETGLRVEDASDEEIRDKIKELKLDVPELATLGRGNLIDALYKKTVRTKIVNPTFVTRHPVELSPLARRNDDDPRRTDRFQLVIAGAEVINAFSELADSDDQHARFAEQAADHAAGDEEAMEMDEAFVRALSHGMPPAAGWGIGIDRLVSLLTGQENLKDVVLFPFLRPEQD